MADQRDDYQEIMAVIEAVCSGEDDPIALMATISCELYNRIDGFDWVGFYRVTAPNVLKIGPYQGGHGCLTIPFDKGVCGAAARTGKTQLVDDVDAFPGHIACASSTKSELVIPVWDNDGALIGVLDIDSDRPAFFTKRDVDALEPMLARLFAGS